MNHRQKHLAACLLAMAALLSMAPIQGTWAQTAPDLGTAANFAALGGTGVTCTTPNPALPAITVTGNVGSGTFATSVTGFPPTGTLCSLSGTIQLNLTGTPAINDLITAYNALASNAPADGYVCPSAIASHNLVGNLASGLQGAVLEPGVYCITGTGLLTSELTLNGGGNSNAVWIFKAESDLTPKNGSVVMANGGNACNVYWQVGSAVDLLNTAFVGNVLAGTAITFTGEAPPTGTASSLNGRALAQSLVTMTGSSISACTGGGTQPPSCDRDHKHHKHCGHHGNDKPHCDGDHDGHHGHHKGHGNGHGWDDDDNGRGNGHGSDHDSPFKR
jgi:hypothetical protein